MRELRRLNVRPLAIAPLPASVLMPPAEPWPEVDASIATADTLPPPPLPLADVFPPGWAAWITRAAAAKGAPAGYVATALLSVAGGLIGNARWAQPWAEWAEPPVMNVALIGPPSAGKSPALDAVVNPLAEIEIEANADWQQRRCDHATGKLAAETRRAAWEVEVKTAVKSGLVPPTMPADAAEPETPQRRRIISTDPTPEKAARLSAANPRGMILQRDELAGWIAGMGRYSSGGGGAERGFWIQAYGGRSWTPDRVKDGDDETAVPHLTWAIVGGIQPDRLATALLQGDDDGLAARFLYCWPEPTPPRRPPLGRSLAEAATWLAKLRNLPWTAPAPLLLPFSEPAQAALQDWREEAARLEHGAAGLFLSWVGKLPGFAVRLALIFAHLAWSEAGHADAPTEIGEPDMLRAVTFLHEYAVPMARRAFGEAALPQAERDARRLARWIQRQRPRPSTVNAKELRRMANGPGIPDAARLDAALAELEGLGWVRRTDPNRAGIGGRSRADWTVNPELARVA